MPVLNDSHTISGSSYGYSAARIGDLGASEYTLGTLVVDISGSVQSFAKQIEAAVKGVVKVCSSDSNPRADNMMLRIVLFNQKVHEVHGFKPLRECNLNDYTGIISPSGTTALYDATYTSVKAATQYAEQLVAQDYDVNACVFVLTDGGEYPRNNSTATRKMCAEALRDAVQSEALESITSILIGINTATGGVGALLTQFKDEVGFTQYVDIANATDKELAKLTGFVSRSFSSQSQSLKTGGPSQSLAF